MTETVTFASELMAIDTSNRGDPDAPGTERPAAEYVAEKLTEVGYDVTYVETGLRRGNVIARLAGRDPRALLIHGHLDVVPADASEWSVHPFAGEVKDGFVWGRGAVDMKGMVAMTLATARRLKRDGVVPPRDLIFAFLSDEEAGGWLGARKLVDERPELFDGATEAISEVGGFSVPLGGERAYLVQVAEKSSVLLELLARGAPGHGAMLHDDNPIARLAAAVDRLDRHRFPLTLTDPVRQFLAGAAAALADEGDDPDALVARLGSLSRLIGASLRDTANVTEFQAGYRSNVVPSVATATVDCRVLPGREDAFRRETESVLGPGIETEWRSLPGVSTSFDGALPAAMAAAIAAEDPGARLLPYLLPAGTDAKSFARLGVRNFGFAPLRLPEDLDFASLFHGVDERVPVDALEFGTRVLDRLLTTDTTGTARGADTTGTANTTDTVR